MFGGGPETVDLRRRAGRRPDAADVHRREIRAAIEIRRRRPDIGVVVLSQYASPAHAVAVLGDESTSLAYLLKGRVGDVAHLVSPWRR